MHRLVLVVPFLAGLAVYQPAVAQPPPGYVAPTAPSPNAPPYARNAGPGGGSQAYNTENCGTPDEPKPCPPLPKVPLQNYPGGRR